MVSNVLLDQHEPSCISNKTSPSQVNRFLPRIPVASSIAFRDRNEICVIGILANFLKEKPLGLFIRSSASKLYL